MRNKKKQGARKKHLQHSVDVASYRHSVISKKFFFYFTKVFHVDRFTISGSCIVKSLRSMTKFKTENREKFFMSTTLSLSVLEIRKKTN